MNIKLANCLTFLFFFFAFALGQKEKFKYAGLMNRFFEVAVIQWQINGLSLNQQLDIFNKKN